MELFDTVKNRCSYRGAYTSQSIPEKNLRKIVQAGLDAPSGRNMQTTRFIIFHDPTKLAQVKAVFAGQPFIVTAQAFIATVIDTTSHAAPEYAYTFDVEDNAAAVENMLLAITALGYASVWLDGVLRSEGRAEKIGKIAGLPSSKIVRVLLPIGVPAEGFSRNEKLSFERRAWFDTWGEKP